MQEVLNIEQFCQKKFIEIKIIYIYKENWGPILELLLEIPRQVGLDGNVFMIFGPKLGEIEFWVSFVIKNKIFFPQLG